MAFKVEIKKWHAIGIWTWEAGDDMCGICRNPFDGCPPESKFPGDDSPVVWGTCGHAFHLQVWLSLLSSSSDPTFRPSFSLDTFAGTQRSYRFATHAAADS